VESATQTLHRLTSVERYDEAREIEPPVDDPGVVQGFTPMDLSRLPWFYKRYHDGLPRIDLPRRLTATTAGAVDVLAGTAHAPRAELDLPGLGRLLFLMSGGDPDVTAALRDVAVPRGGLGRRAIPA
jgi:hypothetical protein